MSTENIRAKEGAIKPPENFRIRGVFGPHVLYRDEKVELFRQGLSQEIEQFFRPGDNNIVFMEDASGDIYNDVDFQDTLKYYGSTIKALAFKRLKLEYSLPSFNDSIKLSRATTNRMVDSQANLLEQHVKLHTNPTLTHLWTTCQVLDQHLKRYSLRIMFENGQVRGKHHDISRPGYFRGMSIEQMLQSLDETEKELEMRSGGESDEGIANQLVKLERSADPSIPTNVLTIFGTGHQRAIQKLPPRLQLVTTISGNFG